VGDILGEGLAGLPPHATASNFGKLVSVRSISKEDFCAALFSMVCETNAVLFSLASKAFDSEKVIAVGRVPSIPYFAKHLNQAARMLGFELIIPKNPELATAVGAALAVEARNKTRF
jgi:activator of 2-hydroxyglutaryl-CoA dehydratase